MTPGQRPERLPWGFRSPPLSWRRVGLWRPLVAVVAGLCLPALVAFALVSLAGLPGGIDADGWLRRQILFVLYALMMAPVLGFLALPLAGPVVLVMAVAGRAGAASAVLAANLLGLPLVHLALHGDLTTEDATILPNLAIALGCQGVATWAAFWAMIGTGQGATRAAPAAPLPQRDGGSG